MRDGAALGPARYLETHYERLVDEPEASLRRIAAFLELPYAAEMAEFHRGRTRTDPGLSAKSAWLPATRGLRDWRAQLGEGDVELYEAIAGDLLERHGYERAFATVSDEAAERAARLRAAWESELAERRGRLATRLDLSIPVRAR
jgi:hypothetical protein